MRGISITCVSVRKCSLTDFKKSIVRSWLNTQVPETPTMRHKLEEIEGTKRVTRRRCSACYKTISKIAEPFGPDLDQKGSILDVVSARLIFVWSAFKISIKSVKSIYCYAFLCSENPNKLGTALVELSLLIYK